jgi:membrane associated rhomboid family serine protease
MLPVATNLRIIKTPWATYTIVAANILVHILVTWYTNFIISDKVARIFGFVPASFGNLNFSAIPTLVTSMFLHGDLLHLTGNMVFLLVFGRKVETQLERLNFSTFFFAAGITAAMTHTLMEPNSYVPLIGASGAISGVLGAFFIYNPRARVTLVLDTVIIYFLRRLTIHLPAWVFLPIWFFLEISMGLKPQTSNLDSGLMSEDFWLERSWPLRFTITFPMFTAHRNCADKWRFCRRFCIPREHYPT